MKIQHYLTIDIGQGPVTLVQIFTEQGERMVRIVQQAVYKKVQEADPEKTKSYIAGLSNVRRMDQSIAKNEEETISEALSDWLSREIEAISTIRWSKSGEGIVMRTREDAIAFDLIQEQHPAEANAPRKRRRMMLG